MKLKNNNKNNKIIIIIAIINHETVRTAYKMTLVSNKDHDGNIAERQVI